MTPLPAGEFESGHRGNGDAAFARSVQDRACQRMLARPLDAGRNPHDLVFVEAFRGHDGDDLRLAFGQRAGLVDDEGVDLFHSFQHFGVPDQHPGLRAPADADHDRHRRRQPERARARDDQDRHRRNEAIGQSRLRAERCPRDECDDGDEDHRRHEPARHLIGEALDRRARPLGRRDHLDDPGEHGVTADLVGAHDEAAAPIEGAADELRPGLLGHRHGFSGHHGFIEGGSSFQQHAVDRNLLAGPDPQAIADIDGVERDVLVAAVGAHPAGGLRREIEQCANRPGGLLAGAQLQDLAEQHQHGDDGGGFEVHRDGAIGAAERGGKDAGRDGCHHAVEPGHTGPHGNQGEHVEIAAHQRLPAAHEERPARPHHDGSRQRQLNPVGNRGAHQHVQVREMTSHLQNHHRNRQPEADPQAAGHVDEFGIGAAVACRVGRFQRHSADRAMAGADLADLRMHRAGVDRPRRRRRDGSLLGEILCGLRREFAPAAGGAEVIGTLLMDVAMRRLMRIDRHAADGVDRVVACGDLFKTVPVPRICGGMCGMSALRSNVHCAARRLVDGASSIGRMPGKSDRDLESALSAPWRRDIEAPGRIPGPSRRPGLRRRRCAAKVRRGPAFPTM